MTRIVIVGAVAAVLWGSAAHAQDAAANSTPLPQDATKPALVFSGVWFTAASLDVWSDHYAVMNANAVEGNPMMPSDPQARYTAVYAWAAAGTWIATRLWQHDHKRWAVALTVGNAVIRGFVAQHNLAVARSAEQGAPR
ncbi:MAG TPA: hypothetical protein VKH42_13615 [Vicinamibacterales bacterium]|nr:hypothetical protein [Vicinamibacterales bacterium]